MGRKRFRICITCDEEKELTRENFYPRYGEPGKWSGRCKQCQQERQGKWKKETKKGIECRNRSNRSPLAKIRFERYMKSRKGKETQKRYRKRNRKKVNARAMFHYYLKRGLIDIREECDICGKSPTESHHPDYDDPFDVEWLCIKCHRGRKHKGCKG